MSDSFSQTHPVTGFLFFLSAIGFSMFLMHPVCVVISLCASFAYALLLGGKRLLLFFLRFLLPTALLIAVINPLVSHRGATILRYLPWDNPLTLESVIYGAASALMLCSAALWFSCLNRVMTSDKLICLFGRAAPALSLVLTMALRFVPRFFDQLRLVRTAQGQIHQCEKKSPAARFKGGVRVLSIMVSWSMENALDTSDSMKSRGYGLGGRTAFSVFRFARRDAFIIASVAAESAGIAALLIFGGVKYRYYPFFKGNFTDAASLAVYVLYALLLLTPLIFDCWEGIRWTRSRSRI